VVIQLFGGARYLPILYIFMILSCLPLATTSKELLHVQQHSATPRPHAPACGSAPVVAIDASNTTLHEWNVQLLRALLARARPTSKERAQMRERIGNEYAYKGSKVYSTLKYTLHQALDDPKFLRLISDKSRGLWLEFGVLTGLSTNITAQYAELARTAQGPQTVHGFDTFTGLPEAWSNGRGGFYYGKGSFSWASRGQGPTPPVRSNVVLHAGLFNVSLAPFLGAARGRPLAWTNIDCDLYGGTRDALGALGDRVCPGTRIHFHELLKDRFWKAKHLAHGRLDSVVASEEARALYEWLRTQPGLQLELLDLTSISNSDAAAFVVHQAAATASPTCP